MAPPTNAMNTEEAYEAARQAGQGAMIGAVKWGAFAAMLGGIGLVMSPVYRGLTVQFKVYLHMAVMALGSTVEGDQRLRVYQAQVRLNRKIARDRLVWQQFEEEYGKGDDE